MRWFWKNKITALKIEGRMKSSAYLALTVGTYRAALDQLARGEFDPRPHLQRLGTATTRPLGTGFFLTRPRILKPPRKKRDFGPLLGRILEKTGSEIWRVQAKQAWDTRRDAAVLLPDMRLAPLAAAGYQVEDAEGVVQTVVHPGWTGFLRTADSAPAPDLFICRPDSGV
jgi:putative protease